MDSLTSPTQPLLSSSGKENVFATWLALAVTGLAMFMVEHNLSATANEMYGTTAEQLEAKADGQWQSQAGIAIMFVVGILCFTQGRRRQWNIQWALFLAVVFFIAWSASSILWSDVRMTTIKRVGSLFACTSICIGLASRLTLREFCQATVVLPLLFVLIGIGAEIALGTFHPWSRDYRFAGTLHPNAQGLNCSALCMAAIFMLPTSKRRGWLIAIFFFGMACLIMTKSRSSLGVMLAAIAIVGLLRGSLKSIVTTVICVTACVAIAVLAANLAGPDSVKSLQDTALMGRDDEVGSLSGRTELWEEVAKYAKRRLVLGYGYRSFWTPERIDEVSSDLYWGMNSAHSMYLETVLGTGLIGLAGFVVLIAAGLVGATVNYRHTGNCGYALILALFLFGVLTGIVESAFVAPSMEAILAGIGAARLALFHGPDESFAEIRQSRVGRSANIGGSQQSARIRLLAREMPS